MTVFVNPTREERRRVPGYGGKYEVSDLGNVYSNGGMLEKVRGMYVSLSGRQEGVHQVKVCYLVARAFVPNLEGRPYVVHVNGDVRDDRAANLEWSEEKEVRRGRKPKREPVVVTDRGGEYVGRFESLAEACRVLDLDRSQARKVLRGEVRSAKGYVIRYEGV